MQKVLKTIFYVFFALTFSWLLINIIAGFVGSRWWPPIVALMAIAALLLCTMRFKEKIDALEPKKFTRGLLVLFILFVLLLTAACNFFAQYPIMDLAVVQKMAAYFVENGSLGPYNDYLIVCNNNVGLFLLLSGWFALMQLFGIHALSEAGLISAGVFNVLMMALAVWFLCRCAARLYKNNLAPLLTMLFSLGGVVLYIWSPYFYTDTLVMPFITGGLLLYLRSRDSEKFLHRLLWMALAASVIFMGFAAKGSAGVAIVAVVIHVLMEYAGGIKKALALAAAAVLIFSASAGVYRLWQRQGGLINFTPEQQVGLPLELWFLYGSHGTGNYSEEDLQYCISFEGLANRKQAVREKMLQNYAAYTPKTYAAFLTKKGVNTWGDGKFGADLFLKNAYRSNFTHYFILEGMPFYWPFTYLCQIVHYTVLLLFLAGLWLRGVRKGTPAAMVVHLCVFGTMLLLCFWESTPRYGVSIQPLLLLGAVDGMVAMCELLGKKRALTAADTP